MPPYQGKDCLRPIPQDGFHAVRTHDPNHPGTADPNQSPDASPTGNHDFYIPILRPQFQED
jgi:hypothetical protein